MYGQEQFCETLQGNHSGVSRGNLSVGINCSLQYTADVLEGLDACVGSSYTGYS